MPGPLLAPLADAQVHARLIGARSERRPALDRQHVEAPSPSMKRRNAICSARVSAQKSGTRPMSRISASTGATWARIAWSSSLMPALTSRLRMSVKPITAKPCLASDRCAAFGTSDSELPGLPC
jgi:hypothetical protein